ncbi:1-acylglycerol-3-phosphate O-acyltransferase ABHD5 [Pangasianodon hypophthalmus]|uniref:1-acylglycerol-3-phosphate O-acyltransferase ABHD5 n=1 Tax=Pangasianodon hypophthalmus TaxID=310915 RepID=UPI002307C42A|nr:1-acylglycerol-3-phosphate O-acyltransferase ABHD5 [Pangasianodon hypophthalmus]
MFLIWVRGLLFTTADMDGALIHDHTVCRQRWWWFSSWLPSWCPTSPSHLRNAEDRILQPLTHSFSRRHVPISNGNYIWTLSFDETQDSERSRVPVVLLHGFGGGVGLWVKNLAALALSGRTVYALDLLGFGQSSRPMAGSHAQEAEEKFVQSLEEWREAVGVELMILLGHDLGGFVSTAYALTHPHRVKNLILVEPWGFSERPEVQEVHSRIPMWVKVLGKAMNPFNPLSLLRLAGPLGPLLLQTLRSDFKQKYSAVFDDDTVPDYLYHLNAQTPSGETAFKNMTVPYGWAQRPMMQRVGMLDPTIPISIICGSRSCIDSQSGHAIHEMRPNSQTDVIVIRGAGHYVFADQSEDFNEVVLKICRDVNNEGETEVEKKEKRKEKGEKE